MKKLLTIVLFVVFSCGSIARAQTTLDPAAINNFSGTGSLSGGNLTLSTTGLSLAQSTTAATSKQTWQVTTDTSNNFIDGQLSSSSSATDGFYLHWSSTNWELIDNGTGTAFATGPTTPAPSTSQVVTLDCDVTGQLVSVRINGTAVFTNQSVAGHAPATWKAVVGAGAVAVVGATFNSTVAFSSLTFAPLSGYSTWDGGGPPPATPRLRTLLGVGQ